MSQYELDVVLSFIQQHPQAAARELELQSQDITAELIKALPLRQGRELISHMLPPYAARLCAHLSLDITAGLLAEFSSNQATAILRNIPKTKREQILIELPEKTAVLCRLLLSYSDDSVGAWMSADIVMLPPNCLAAEALQRFANTNGATLGDALPVVDSNNYLVGLVSIRDLLNANKASSISHLCIDAPAPLSSRASLATAAHHEEWQQYDVLPVINRNKELIGLLAHADLRRSLEQYGEIPRAIPQNNFLSNMGEAYIGSLVALLALLGNKSDSESMLGEHR
ncbi:CBS domain-containing protein [Dasania sp. GY-MA-18]|uniref:CBS domain-containing protein n=1 Tax=Dasania phycosphaerae TaxID=2950436 RepID=A0A9J6RHG2_9GAMM|nr:MULTISPECIES: CBS domain-containing protein [Dasania]MCR8921219.1 CBS domain-containing protein [Dasania sp. GY-MA-18]MCZ0863647.1 CBS domain-containing protein [Dasania phycosphaerae]MCZ0867375.1 CBS domain-containing protein [Dasania phycosphaerae]